LSVGRTPQRTSAADEAQPPRRMNQALNWPQFRGRRRWNLFSDQSAVDLERDQNVKWKSVVPGRGRSSPCSSASESGSPRRPRPMSGRSPRDRTDAAGGAGGDRSGVPGPRHRHTTLPHGAVSGGQPAAVNLLNSYATPTRSLNPAGCIAIWHLRHACLDSDSGEVLWKRQLPLNHHQGPGSSPACTRTCSSWSATEPISSMSPRWTNRPATRSGKPTVLRSARRSRHSASPSHALGVRGRREGADGRARRPVVCLVRTGGGHEIWRVDNGKGRPWRLVRLWRRPGVSQHGRVQWQGQLWAVRVDGQGDVTSTHVAWKLPSSIGFMASPLLLGASFTS